jgi:polysaccharide deacetylase family protein (PEP-CTERM system associated)
MNIEARLEQTALEQAGNAPEGFAARSPESSVQSQADAQGFSPARTEYGSDRVQAPALAGRITNAMTIDVEDYFHVSVFDGVIPRSQWDRLESRVCRNTDRLLQIFAEHGVSATFFVLGWVAERFPDLARRIAGSGHEVASHGYGHRLVYDQTPAAFRQDVRRSKLLLEDAVGAPVHGYRAPSYSIVPRSLWALDILIEEGYAYDASIFPIRHDRYGIPVSARHPYVIERPHGCITEAPGSTTCVGPANLPIAGGGYFRLLPYAWTRWGVRRVNAQEQRPVIFYLHPWEIDPRQPRLPAGMLGRLRHYRNLDQTGARLRQLLVDFGWGPLGSILPSRQPSDFAPGASLALPYQW